MSVPRRIEEFFRCWPPRPSWPRPARIARGEPGQRGDHARFDAPVVAMAGAGDVFDLCGDAGEFEPMRGFARLVDACFATAHEQHALPAVLAERASARHVPFGKA